MLQKIADRKATLQAVDHDSKKRAKGREESQVMPAPDSVQKSLPPSGLPPLKMISPA